MGTTLYEESSLEEKINTAPLVQEQTSKAGDILQSTWQSNGESTETPWGWGMGIEG